MCMRAVSLQLCPTLCNSMDCSPPGSSVHGILEAKILEWVACPPPEYLPDPKIEPASLTSPACAGRFFTTSTTWEVQERVRGSQRLGKQRGKKYAGRQGFRTELNRLSFSPAVQP